MKRTREQVIADARAGLIAALFAAGLYGFVAAAMDLATHLRIERNDAWTPETNAVISADDKGMPAAVPVEARGRAEGGAK
jgi:hypothetical protein